MTSQNFASKSGSVESLKTRVRCGLISVSLQTRCTVALETPNSRGIRRQVHCAPPPGWPRGFINSLATAIGDKPAFAAQAGLILQSPKPASDISPSPLCDLVKVHADPRSDGTNSHTLGCPR